MTITPSGQPDEELADFIGKLEQYCNDEDQPILALLGKKFADDEWRNRAIDYLIANCGTATDHATSYYINVLAMICDYYDRKDSGKLMRFANNKLSEVEAFVEKANSLDKEESSNLEVTGHTIVWLIKAIDSNDAIAVMERLYEENKDNEYGWLTKTCLDYMKKK